jgi:Lipase maturation factor
MTEELPFVKHRFFDPRVTYHATRFAIIRLLGFVYFVAFFSIARQMEPLLGAHGLMPAQAFLDHVARSVGSRWDATVRLPSLFWITGASDGWMTGIAWVGAALSLAVMFGVTNAIVQLVLWALYMSIVHVGQIFYGYGWEMQLLETGALAIFLCPVRSFAPFPPSPPPVSIIWLFRWLIVRVMLGAGLIKLRGDPCWRDLTCLAYHYETQPIPSPLSYLFHAMPMWAHKIGAVFNYLVELGAPLVTFAPRRLRHIAGALYVTFQIVLILSGNLAFLNWLTLIPALACFDDTAMMRLLPEKTRARVRGRLLVAPTRPSDAHRIAAYVYGGIVAILSVAPVANLFSERQLMNYSWEPLHLVNTYGAFGSVGRERNEIILEGTSDERLGPETVWRAYELPCKPGDPMRRPCLITPYHYRLDWQIWFAAMSSYD